MPTAQGLAFLEALTKYIDFRLAEKEPLKPAVELQPFLLEFENRFKDFLLLSKKADKNSEAFKHLMGGIEAMKTGGGGAGRPPNK